MIEYDRVTTVVLLWGRGALVGLSLFIFTSKHMTSKAATEAAAWMRAAGEQDTQYSEADDYSPAVADKKPVTPVDTGARGHTRAPPSLARSAAVGRTVDHGPEIDVVYSGESYVRLEIVCKSRPDGRGNEDCCTSRQSRQRAAYEMLGSSDEFENSSPVLDRPRSRIRMRQACNKRT